MIPNFSENHFDTLWEYIKFVKSFKCSTKTGTETEINYFSRTENRNVRTGMVSVHFKMFVWYFSY